MMVAVVGEMLVVYAVWTGLESLVAPPYLTSLLLRFTRLEAEARSLWIGCRISALPAATYPRKGFQWSAIKAQL